MTQIYVQTVFDLSDQITDKGSYSVQDSGNYYGNPLFIILPERQLVYQASISKDTTRAGSKVFYNFSRPTLSSSRVYVQDGMAQVNPIYYINQSTHISMQLTPVTSSSTFTKSPRRAICGGTRSATTPPPTILCRMRLK